MSEYMPNRMSVGGDHSKKVISQITIKLENHVITFQITITNLMNTDAGLTLFEKIVLPSLFSDNPLGPFPKWPFGQCTNLRVIMRGTNSSETLLTILPFWDGSKPWYLVNPKIAGKWMFIPLKMVLIGIDPYPYWYGSPTGIPHSGHHLNLAMDGYPAWLWWVNWKRVIFIFISSSISICQKSSTVNTT